MSSSHVQVSPDGSGKDIDTDALTSDEAGNPTVYRQDVVIADPTTYGNKAGVSSSATANIGGPTAENVMPALTLYPVPVSGQDNIGIVRSLLTDGQGTLFVLHRYEVFDELLSELKKITVGISMLVGEDLTELDQDKS